MQNGIQKCQYCEKEVKYTYKLDGFILCKECYNEFKRILD